MLEDLIRLPRTVLTRSSDQRSNSIITNDVDTINYFLSLIQLLRTVLTRSNSQRSNSFTTNSNDTINTQTTTVHNLLDGAFKPIPITYWMASLSSSPSYTWMASSSPSP